LVIEVRLLGLIAGVLNEAVTAFFA
jgi:hypothetical protein